MSFQIIAKSEDGRERLPERYPTREAAQAYATQMQAANHTATASRGGEWFQATYYEVVEAAPARRYAGEAG